MPLESESHDEQLSRVRMMAEGNDTWDLSENDCAALKMVLRERDALLYWLKRYADNAYGHPSARIVIGEAEGKRMRIELPIPDPFTRSDPDGQV